MGFPVEEVIANAASQPAYCNNAYFVDGDESAAELNRILAAPLEEWRLFLHPKQKEFVYKNYNGSVRVIGGAGTGKTVVAMHRAKWLAETQCTKPGDKILVTTFTSNLAEDIKANLKILCTNTTFNKIEIVNLDKWVSNYLSLNLFFFGGQE